MLGIALLGLHMIDLQAGDAYTPGAPLDQRVGSAGKKGSRRGRLDMKLDELWTDVPESEIVSVASKIRTVEDVWNTPYNPWLTKDDFRTRVQGKFDWGETMPSDAAFDVIFDSFNMGSPQVDAPEKVESVVKSWYGSGDSVRSEAVQHSVFMGRAAITTSIVLFYLLSYVLPLALLCIVAYKFVLPNVSFDQYSGLLSSLPLLFLLGIFVRAMTSS